MAETRTGRRQAKPGEAAQALSTILQTNYLRYWLIASWAIALAVTIPPLAALAWFVLTSAAGAVRGWFEKRIASGMKRGWGAVFPAVGAATTVFWAAAPVLAWTSHHAFGRPLALSLIGVGYLLVFSQLRNSPKQALAVSAPYTAVLIGFAASLWGTPDFWPLVAAFPMMASGLAVHTIVSAVGQAKITAFQDHQAHLIAELKGARDKADAANKAKSAFLAVVSHELRTPMNGVLGAAQLLSSSRLDATQREYVSIVRNSGDSLLALLNDILDLTKIEADRMQLEAIEIELPELVERLGAAWTARAREKGVDYVVDLDPMAPVAVIGDPNRLSQIVHNLLSNAVKFTDKGAVRLKLSSERLEGGRARLSFAVSDTGPGIAQEDVERLFQPFTQLDASSTRRFGGTGLGLTISRKLAEMMGGELTLESTPGQGSTFVLTIDAEVRAWARAKVEEEVTADLDSGEPLKVLVVEDHPVNRMLVEAWLASSGHATASAENGQLALNLCEAQAYDLILMDVNMPVMDGLTATRRLRETEGPNRETPVVILSASARAEDHEAGYAAGADAYVNKPIDFKALAGLLHRVPSGREGLRPAA
ncbi:ATP-binding protein [Caulobacter sp. 17J65-9]|uniref:ATP-binding protein n=1 Tax=Caulobacter sp. 17J65-9 TaxID=2709382 RepID=UPI0013CBEA73|nr:ATP-binding protein [Caulobacter sp. 17J65-9]NEX92027.1 response regulator [Caulobacter sp. 17J65-9]